MAVPFDQAAEYIASRQDEGRIYFARAAAVLVPDVSCVARAVDTPITKTQDATRRMWLLAFGFCEPIIYTAYSCREFRYWVRKPPNALTSELCVLTIDLKPTQPVSGEAISIN
jgi:hypothetical protein